MPSIVNYKCPSCTGPLRYVGSSGKLECEYCGSIYDVEEIEALQKPQEEAAQQNFEHAEQQAAVQAEQNWDTSALSSDWGAEAGSMRAYNCQSCGAEIICDETTAATSCPYCGNNAIIPGQFAGSLRPDLIIPFKLDKAAAERALKNHYHGKKFLPKAFSQQNHIEQVKGVYVPFWLFDGTADVQARFEGTRSYVTREGDYRVTTTEHFDIYRAGTVDFEKVPVDASTKMPDNHMDSIEPFDYSEIKDFSTAYLPGYLADKYDVTPEDCAERADTRCADTAVSEIAATVNGYEMVIPGPRNVRLNRGKVRYALFPVWMLNTKWNGQNYLFAMNGQTGKLVGDLPVDKKRYWSTFALIAAAVTAVVAALVKFLV